MAIIYICYSVMCSTLYKFQSMCLDSSILKTTNLTFVFQNNNLQSKSMAVNNNSENASEKCIFYRAFENSLTQKT